MTAMIFAAFQLGFVYSLLPGPVIIASSQRAVTGGWRQGLWFIVGVTLADLFYIAVINWGLSDIMTNSPLLSLAFWVLGGGWLVKLGLDAMRVPLDEQWFRTAIRKTLNFRRTMVDGLLINLLSPLTVVGWIALGANFIAQDNSNIALPDNANLITLLAILAGVLAWQVLIVGVASLLRQQINRRLLKTLSLIGGVCLIVYGLGAWISAAHLITA
jgi:threonine/homoserine/homoserine lactone efflux protein